MFVTMAGHLSSLGANTDSELGIPWGPAATLSVRSYVRSCTWIHC